MGVVIKRRWKNADNRQWLEMLVVSVFQKTVMALVIHGLLQMATPKPELSAVTGVLQEEHPAPLARVHIFVP